MSDQMLLIRNKVGIVLQLLRHEKMLRIQQLSLDPILERVVPHKHNRVLQEIHSVLLYDARQLVAPNIENLQGHYVFLDLLLRRLL